MPDLPTVTVSAAQATRILAAFKARAGVSTQAEAVTAYQAWLTDQVRDVVLTHEGRQLDEAHNTSKRESLEAIRKALPDTPTAT